MEKKITNKQKFEMIHDVLLDENMLDLAEFINEEIAKLDRKAAKAKETAAKKKEKPDELKDTVAALLTEDLQTTADILKALDDEEISAAKVTYRLTSLCKEGFARKEAVTVESDGKKKKAMAYALANTEEA